MPDVDATTERLRAEACGPDEYRHWNYVEAVTLEVAESAVLSAVDARTAEIVDALRDDGPGWLEDDAYADFIARRFPDGGTNDG